MKLRVLGIWMALVFLLVLSACERKVPLKSDFSSALKITPQLDRKEKTLSVKVELTPGYHAYAPREEVGVPVSLNVEPKNGWRPVGETIVPPGVEKTLGSLGKSRVLFGTFIVKTGVDSGNGPLFGSIHIQICTEGLCDRPRKHAFKVDVAGIDRK